jgi:hypothetical protein
LTTRARSARALAPLLALAVLTASGCETSAEKSAELEKSALKAQAARPAAHGLQITRANPDVKVVATTLLHSSEGSAAVVTLRNSSSHALHDVPIAVELVGAGGQVVYTNTEAGVAKSLISVGLVPAHGVLSWVDDQIRGSGTLRVRIGPAPTASGPIPSVAVSRAQLSEEAGGAGALGTVTNHSGVAQQELVVFAIARRGGRIVAAGRSVLPTLPGGSSAHFQAFLVGAAAGARLAASAPPTTLG